MNKEAYEKDLISRVLNSVERHGGNQCLSSIILTGSFGRGEPTYTVSSEGDVQLKSDVEIAMIFPKTASKEAVETLIADVCGEFDEDLNLMPLNEDRVRKVYNFNYSIRVPKYKTMFTYDLFNGSKTIWGTDFIGQQQVSLDQVDIYEAKRLVANRIGELVYLQENADRDQAEYLRKQWKGKLLLAIVSAFLIGEKSYVSSYHGQFNAMEKMSDSAERILGKGFINDYKDVFYFLRENGASYEVSDDRLRKYVKNIDKYFRTKKINNPRVNSSSRYIKYCIKYLKTGVKFGFLRFEDSILQALIHDYWSESDKVRIDAETWHRVLY